MDIREKIRFYARIGRSRNEIYDALTQPRIVIRPDGKRVIVRNHTVTRREVQRIVQSVPPAERRESRRLWLESKEEKIEFLMDEYGLSRREAIQLVRIASYEALMYRHDKSRKEQFETVMNYVDSDYRRRQSLGQSPIDQILTV